MYLFAPNAWSQSLLFRHTNFMKNANLSLLLVLAALFFVLVPHRGNSATYELHHVFPRSMSGYFNSVGINPDLWCIPLSAKDHRGKGGAGIHTMRFACSGGLDYLSSWRMFAQTNPRGPKESCFAFAALLLSEYGIRGKLDFYDYKTRRKTGKDVELGKKVTRQTVEKLKSLPARMAKKLLFVYIAYESFMFACAADDIYPDEKFLGKAEDAFLKATENSERNLELASKDLARAYLYLAVSVFSKYAEGNVDFYKEVLSFFSDKTKQKQLSIALYCLKRSVHLDAGNPFAQLLYAEALYWNKEYRLSRKHAEEALILFRKFGDVKMENSSRRLINAVRKEL